MSSKFNKQRAICFFPTFVQLICPEWVVSLLSTSLALFRKGYLHKPQKAVVPILTSLAPCMCIIFMYFFYKHTYIHTAYMLLPSYAFKIFKNIFQPGIALVLLWFFTFLLINFFLFLNKVKLHQKHFMCNSNVQVLLFWQSLQVF